MNQQMELSLEKPEGLMKLYDEGTGLYKFIRTDKSSSKSLDAVERTLHRLGLSKNEIRVYLHLARTGEHKASEISETLSLHRTETYRILRDLEKKGLISSVFEKPLKFIGTPFEKALDILIETRKMKIHALESGKMELVKLWLSLPRLEVEHERKEVFQILEGDDQINLKAEEILGKASDQILVFTSESDIASFYHTNLLDRLEKASRNRIDVQLLANYSPKNCFFIEKTKLKNAKYSVANIDELPTFIIIDDQQLLLLIRTSTGKKRVAALWTNYDAFVKVLKTLFIQLSTKND